MPNLRFAAAAGACFCSLTLAACGGGTQRAQALVPGGSRAASVARFVIAVPGASAALAGTARHPHYVSPATQSVATVTDPGTANEQTFSVDLTASNPSCSVAGPVAPLTCTVTLSLAPGAHTANFFTYDRPGGSAGGGHVLSQNASVPFTVAATGATTVPVTLDGVPKSILIAPRQGNGHVFPIGAGFGIAGSQPQHFFAAFLDAGGYTIIGPGTPAPAFSIADPGSVALVVNPANPLQMTLQTKHFASAPVNLTVSATPPAGSGAAAVSVTLPVTTLQELWATATQSSTAGEVVGYAILPGPSLAAIPSDTIPFVGDAFLPAGIAVDGAGTLWVSSNNAGDVNPIEAFTPGTTTPIAADTINVPPLGGGHQYPTGLAFDSSGTLWAAPFQGNSLLAYAPGTMTPVAADAIPIHASIAIAFDASGNLWATNQIRVHEYLKGATTPVYSATIGNAASGFIFGNAYGLAFDADGTLWISDAFKNIVQAFVPGTATPIANDTITSGLRYPGGVAVDGHGTLWVANGGGNSLNAYRRGFDAVSTAVDLAGYSPSFVALSP